MIPTKHGRLVINVFDSRSLPLHEGSIDILSLSYTARFYKDSTYEAWNSPRPT